MEYIGNKTFFGSKLRNSAKKELRSVTFENFPRQYESNKVKLTNESHTTLTRNKIFDLSRSNVTARAANHYCHRMLGVLVVRYAGHAHVLDARVGDYHVFQFGRVYLELKMQENASFS